MNNYLIFLILNAKKIPHFSFYKFITNYLILFYKFVLKFNYFYTKVKKVSLISLFYYNLLF